MDKIAVIVNADELAATLFEGSFINVYDNKSGEWHSTRSIPIKLQPQMGMAAVRQSVLQIIEDLGDCKIIVGCEVSGFAYNILSASGFAVFEMEGSPYAFLGMVWEAFKQATLQDASSDENNSIDKFQPRQTDIEGNYYIDLQEVQSTNPNISSKQILIPFLRNTKFHELEVVCGHVPPWLDFELKNLCLKMDVEKVKGNKYKLSIYRKPCTE
ncbi:MAG: Fe-only nitrogenase accessory protein AnfO [Clostridia bacterium]|nr:Fe-only nitrogenase accessory protein AnfO [Clostridia bacterium]